MTRKQIEDRVKATVGLQDTQPMDETGLVRDWIYNGTIDLLSRTRCVVRCVHLGVTAGTDTYTLAHSLLALVDVENGARRRRRDDTGEGFTLIRSDVLRISPTPSADGDLDVWAVIRPVKMANDNDDLGAETFGAIPDEFQDAIELYALWHAADYSHEDNTQRGERYRVLYEGQDTFGGRLRQIKMLVNKRGTALAPRRKVSGRRSLTPRSAWVD